jgi:hypothetical protein
MLFLLKECSGIANRIHGHVQLIFGPSSDADISGRPDHGVGFSECVSLPTPRPLPGT